MMDAKLKAQWVNALRSGEFEQCQFQLTDGQGFCCIGVGYEVLGRRCVELDNEADDQTDVAAEVLGLGLHASSRLIAMNDDEGMSFAEIADWIEAHL